MKKIIVVVCLICFLASMRLVFADGQMAKVTRVKSRNRFLKNEPANRIYKGKKVSEDEAVVSYAGQVVELLLDDGTRLVLGPSTEIKIKNWFQRDSHGYCKRIIEITKGLLWAKVRKIYSKYEPFIVKSPFGVVSVRGTEFIYEVGEGGKLSLMRDWKKELMLESKAEAELHVLEGEVDFAKTINDLEEQKVTVLAGETSLIRDGMDLPQSVHEYNLALFQKYIHNAMPDIQLEVNRSISNEKRAQWVVSTKSQSTVQTEDKTKVAPKAELLDQTFRRDAWLKEKYR